MSEVLKNLKLSNSYEIPTVGLGTYQSEPGEVTRAVRDAIDAGYRHFDCAFFYGNEAEIGKALLSKIKDGTIERKDVFVTSKLWNNFHCKEQVVPMLKETLKELKLDYVDLYLIHWPFGFKKDTNYWPAGLGAGVYSETDYLETWEGMEECIKQGLTRSIGVSNFNSEQIERLLKVAKIQPVVNQVEVNPNVNQKKLIKFCRERQIVITGYCPLGRNDVTRSTGIPSPTILDPKISNIAKKYNKTAAQIVLNYLISLGISIVPKSVTKSRIEENIDIFNFKLEEEDVAYLDSCNKNQRVCGVTAFQDHKYYPFNIEF